MNTVLILGGAGAIGRRAIAASLACSAASHVIVADISLEAAEKAAAAHPGRAEALQLDVFDEPALRAAIARADAVLNCAGPFFRTSLPCLKAAIAEKRIYLDVCDGWDTTAEALRLSPQAEAAGVAAVIGLGAAPGISNLLARIAASELDRCDEIVTGANMDPDPLPGAPVSRAPTRAVHWARQLGREIDAWRGGALSRVKPLQTIRLDMPYWGQRVFHTIGHPEPLTLPASVQGLKDASHVIVLSRREALLAEALLARVAAGALTPEAATLTALDPDKRPLGLKLSVALSRRLAGGFKGQLPAIFAYAEGRRDGRARRVVASITRLPPGGAAGAAATALAIGMKMALTHRLDRRGVCAPEAILDPHIFFEEMSNPATPRGTAPGPLIRIETAEGA